MADTGQVKDEVQTQQSRAHRCNDRLEDLVMVRDAGANSRCSISWTQPVTVYIYSGSLQF